MVRAAKKQYKDGVAIAESKSSEQKELDTKSSKGDADDEYDSKRSDYK